MTDSIHPIEHLEDALGARTEWEGPLPDPPVWQAAARRHRKRVVGTRLGIVASAACVVLLAGVAILPALGTARRAPVGAAAERVSSLQQPSLDGAVDNFALGDGSMPSSGPQSSLEIPGRLQSDHHPAPSSIAEPSAPRAVMYTDMVRITVEDLARAFVDAKSIAEPALGEFIESSSFTGSDQSAVAEITLRVRAARRGEVLLAVRSLGEVTSERTRASDVSDQIVDLDARLRNERRVEAELLELLDTREDAPLDEILSVRSELSRVRTQIERMEAQVASIRDRVALSEVRLTLVQPAAEEPEPEPEPEPTLWEEFTEDLAESWDDGLHAVTGSIAWLVRVAVGGAMFWIALLLIGIPIYKWVRS